MFSKTEERVLRMISKRKRITIKELACKYFKGREKPYDQNAVVSSAILRINKKCKFYNLTWFINSSGLGRRGKSVWRDSAK